VSFSVGGFPMVGGAVDEEAIGIALGGIVEATGTGYFGVRRDRSRLVLYFFSIDVVEEMALIPYQLTMLYLASVMCLYRDPMGHIWYRVIIEICD
jgi:hypothetical protein